MERDEDPPADVLVDLRQLAERPAEEKPRRMAGTAGRAEAGACPVLGAGLSDLASALEGSAGDRPTHRPSHEPLDDQKGDTP